MWIQTILMSFCVIRLEYESEYCELSIEGVSQVFNYIISPENDIFVRILIGYIF